MNVALSQLWLMVLVAGALCWIASALIHMLLKYHNADYSELSNETEVATELRKSNAPPALYTLPHCKDMKAMGEESMQKKFADGPVAMVTILPNGMPPMGKLLVQQLLFFILGSALIAYIASMAIPVAADYSIVFRLVFVTALIAYGWGQIPHSIWMGIPWSNCIRYIIDAIIFASITAGVFAWLWPD